MYFVGLGWWWIVNYLTHVDFGVPRGHLCRIFQKAGFGARENSEPKIKSHYLIDVK